MKKRELLGSSASRAEAEALLFESNKIAVKQNAELPFNVRRSKKSLSTPEFKRPERFFYGRVVV